MSGIGHNVAREQLRAFVERIERLEEEQKAINDDKRDVYAEAKGNGFDTKVMKKIIADRRKDSTERQEFNAIYDLYASALGMLPADEAVEYTDIETVNEPKKSNDFYAHTRTHDEDNEFPAPQNPEGDGGRPIPSTDPEAQKAGPEVPAEQDGESQVSHGVQSEQQSAAEPQGRNEPVSGEAAFADDLSVPGFLRRDRANA